jgi:choline monooxygenase
MSPITTTRPDRAHLDADLAAKLDRTRRPGLQARGLPNEAYTGRDFERLEREQLLWRTWTVVGVASDLPRPGWVKPVDLLGAPLLLVRGRDDRVRVYHNVCSHRGVKLVAEPGRVKSLIKCPYHCFCYDVDDGSLKHTPHFGGQNVDDHAELDRSLHGLKEVASAVWFDLVFVNVAGNAPPFDAHIAPLAERWAAYDLSRLRHGGAVGGAMDFHVDCNWKLAVENYCESYHLPWVHPNLNSYSKLSDHYNIVEERFAGQGSRVYAPSDDAPLPQFPNLPEWARTGAEYIAFFPNVLLGVQCDHAFTIWLEPQGPEKTVEHLNLYYVGDDAVSDAYRDSRAATIERWQEVFQEDVDVVQRMQLGRHSPAFEGGFFSPVMDPPTRAFHEWAARALTEDLLDRAPELVRAAE